MDPALPSAVRRDYACNPLIWFSRDIPAIRNALREFGDPRLPPSSDSGDARFVAANTLFEIGSLTKVFTALLLADMVHRKDLRFDDAVDA